MTFVDHSHPPQVWLTPPTLSSNHDSALKGTLVYGVRPERLIKMWKMTICPCESGNTVKLSTSVGDMESERMRHSSLIVLDPSNIPPSLFKESGFDNLKPGLCSSRFLWLRLERKRGGHVFKNPQHYCQAPEVWTWEYLRVLFLIHCSF